MAFFKKDYNMTGPGVPKNAPRKKGVARFFEIFTRDFGNLVKLNLIYQLCLLPAEALAFCALLAVGSGGGALVILFAALALVCSIPVGPATTAMYYIIGKMLRDDPGFVWHDFKKTFKENFRSTVVPGIIFALVIVAQLIGVVYYMTMQGAMGIVMMAIFFFSVLVFTMASPYFFAQSAYVELRTGQKLQNSIYLALGFAPRSFMGALLGAGLIIAQILLFPLAIVVTLFFGYAIPCLLCMMWIWPPMDKNFKIEATLKERRAAELNELSAEEE